jgi:hypothetical protein
MLVCELCHIYFGCEQIYKVVRLALASVHLLYWIDKMRKRLLGTLKGSTGC